MSQQKPSAEQPLHHTGESNLQSGWAEMLNCYDCVLFARAATLRHIVNGGNFGGRRSRHERVAWGEASVGFVGRSRLVVTKGIALVGLRGKSEGEAPLGIYGSYFERNFAHFTFLFPWKFIRFSAHISRSRSRNEKQTILCILRPQKRFLTSSYSETSLPARVSVRPTSRFPLTWKLRSGNEVTDPSTHSNPDGQLCQNFHPSLNLGCPKILTPEIGEFACVVGRRRKGMLLFMTGAFPRLHFFAVAAVT